MHKHPTDGVSGAQPRVPGAGGNGKVSKEELSALNREYLNSRNRSQAAKAEAAEIALAEKKGALVSRRLVALQASFLLSAFRQRVQSEPATLAGQLVHGGLIPEARQHEAQETIKGNLVAVLHELAELPARLADPNWTNEIDADLLGQVNGEPREEREPRTPSEARALATKAKVRHGRRLEQQRQRRASQ